MYYFYNGAIIKQQNSYLVQYITYMYMYLILLNKIYYHNGYRIEYLDIMTEINLGFYYGHHSLVSLFIQ